jgi:hypothetical protein
MDTSWRQWFTRLFRAILYAFNIRSLGLCALSCLSVALSQYLGLTYNVEFSFIALGITFPLTFNSKRLKPQDMLSDCCRFARHTPDKPSPPLFMFLPFPKKNCCTPHQPITPHSHPGFHKV